MGAIQITDDENPKFEKSIRHQSLSEKEIAAILRGYKDNPLGMTDDFKAFRISIAGAQEKAAFLYYKKEWNIPVGVTPTSHIFKRNCPSADGSKG